MDYGSGERIATALAYSPNLSGAMKVGFTMSNDKSPADNPQAALAGLAEHTSEV